MRAAFASLLLFALAGPARADVKAEARTLYEQATAHYDRGEYDAAIGEFKQAYELTHEPGLLFNLAQTYRLKKDAHEALHFYQRYLELKPDATNRADAEAQMAKMKEAIAAEQPQKPPPVAAPPPAVVASPVAAPPPAPPQSRASRFVHSRRGQIAIALYAVGAAALISAAGTGGAALSIRSRYDAGCASGACDAGLYSYGRGHAIATDVLIGVGVASALAATLVAVIRPRERPVTLGMRW